MEKPKSKYCCEKCNYFTNVKQNIDKHVLTQRHLLQQEKTIEVIKEERQKEIEECKFICQRCNKRYKCYSGLWNHRQKCKDVKKPPAQPQPEKQSAALKEVIQLKDQVDDLRKLIIELIKENPTSIMTNSNNTNNFNISIFLNEKCKNAKNMVDFVREIPLELNDLLEIGNGYVDGMTKIITDKLNDCDLHERPMHYHNKIHIRDENEWKEDKDEVKEVFDKSINILDRKLDNMHSKYMIDPRMTREVGTELRNHTGIIRENVIEQEKIIENISDFIKIP